MNRDHGTSNLAFASPDTVCPKINTKIRHCKGIRPTKMTVKDRKVIGDMIFGGNCWMNPISLGQAYEHSSLLSRYWPL